MLYELFYYDLCIKNVMSLMIFTTKSAMFSCRFVAWYKNFILISSSRIFSFLNITSKAMTSKTVSFLSSESMATFFMTWNMWRYFIKLKFHQPSFFLWKLLSTILCIYDLIILYKQKIYWIINDSKMFTTKAAMTSWFVSTKTVCSKAMRFLSSEWVTTWFLTSERMTTWFVTSERMTSWLISSIMS